MSNTLTIEYTDDVLFSLGLSDREFSREAKFLLAAKLYELGRLSSGKAAKLAEMQRVEFLFSLSKVGVPLSNLKIEDLADELKFVFDE